MHYRQQLSTEDLTNLTPAGARDIVVRCFFNAQRETFERAASQMGRAPEEAELRKTVEGAVRLAFRSVAADFDYPTKGTLLKAVQRLSEKAAAMGTPADIIEHHRCELGKVFEALPDDPA
jgi:hypothetical protein